MLKKVAEDTMAQLINEQMIDSSPAAAKRAVGQLILIADARFKLQQHADAAAARAVPW